MVARPPLHGSFLTIDQAFDAAAAQHGDRDAYVEGSQRLSFAAWHRASDALAGALVDRGVRPGDVVALRLPSSIDYAIAYGAGVLAGAVTTGINPRLGPREVSAILQRCRPAVLITDPELGELRADRLTEVIERGRLARLYEGSGLGAERPVRQPADPVTIIWTSGTTGAPKGAWFDHRNLAGAVLTAGVMSAPYDRKLVGTPFPHAGYMAKLWDQLAWGSAVVISATPWSATDMVRSIVDERITVAGGVPTQWSKLLQLPDVAEADFSSLRLCLAATAPASPELVERVTTVMGCPMIVRYAMTESPSITGTEPGDPAEVLLRTVGRPQAGVTLRIVDEHGQQVDPGVVGRVCVHGPCVMRGYWNEPELTSKVLSPDGWLTSSDLGFIDPHGNLVLAGRVDDLYIRGGYNVYPLEVEHVLSEHPAVGQAAVVGMPAPVIGEIGVAFVVPADPQHPPTLDELRQWVRGHLADYKAPDRLEIVAELPLTAMSKVDKGELRRMAAS
jgi:acyl-CoA synthetase (AMP-forming)/AMP-acid ligase II